MDHPAHADWFCPRTAKEWRDFAAHSRDLEESVDMTDRERAYLADAIMPAIKLVLYLDTKTPGVTMRMVRGEKHVAAMATFPDGTERPVRVEPLHGHKAKQMGIPPHISPTADALAHFEALNELTGGIAQCYATCNAAANDRAPEAILLIDCGHYSDGSPLIDAETQGEIRAFLTHLLQTSPPRFHRVLCAKASFVAVKAEDVVFDGGPAPTR